MMKLSFRNKTLDLNIFNLQRQPDGFSDADHSTLNYLGDFCYDELEFEHLDNFVVEYESFSCMMSLHIMYLTLICAL